MNAMHEALAEATTPLYRFEAALNQQSILGKGKLIVDFADAYPLLEQYIARRTRKRVLLDEFNAAFGHDVKIPQFRKLLNAERQRRSACGDVAVCSACGTELRTSKADDDSEGSP